MIDAEYAERLRRMLFLGRELAEVSGSGTKGAFDECTPPGRAGI